MDNGNVAEVTSLQSAIYLKFGRSPEHVMARISPGYMLSLKFGWNWMEIVGAAAYWKGYFQSAPNDLNLTRRIRNEKYPT